MHTAYDSHRVPVGWFQKPLHVLCPSFFQRIFSSIKESRHSTLHIHTTFFLKNTSALLSFLLLEKRVRTPLHFNLRQHVIPTHIINSAPKRVLLKGYRVTICRNPYEALTLVEQLRFDIVLIDVGLPKLNGLELYLAIKRITPSTVAIMLSGRGAEGEQLAQEAVRQTAYTVLSKPLDLERLIHVLQRITRQQASGKLHKPPMTHRIEGTG